MTAVTTRSGQTASTGDGYTVVKARHPGRWLSAAVIIVIAGLLLLSVMTNPNFGWDVVGLYLRDVSIGRGILVTLGLTAISMAIGIVLARILGPEEDLAHRLATGLDPDQRALGISAEIAPDDILTRADPVAEFLESLDTVDALGARLEPLADTPVVIRV